MPDQRTIRHTSYGTTFRGVPIDLAAALFVAQRETWAAAPVGTQRNPCPSVPTARSPIAAPTRWHRQAVRGLDLNV